MSPEKLLDALAETLTHMYQETPYVHVVRADEGVLLVVRGGEHMLVEVHPARLEVAS